PASISSLHGALPISADGFDAPVVEIAHLSLSLCEDPALPQKLIGCDDLAEPRLVAAVAAVAIGVIFAHQLAVAAAQRRTVGLPLDRKSTRLNSSHVK